MTYKSLSQLKRNHFRLTVQLPVEYYVFKFNNQPVEHLKEKKGIGEIHDLGEGGLSFFSSLQLPLEMVIGLRFHLPELGNLNILCRIIRVRKTATRYLVAVRFLNGGNKNRDLIRRFIEKQVKHKTQLVEYM
ncbi:MAG TPA: PilZ domain-containing protein [Bacillota bacterium]|nr:PilZ domain-containing protein [Bacillota bacterium]